MTCDKNGSTVHTSESLNSRNEGDVILLRTISFYDKVVQSRQGHGGRNY